MEIKTQRKLDYLADTKADIKAALIEKGQTVSDADPFRSYGDKVRAIETGGGGGSLPAGVYLSASSIPNPTSYRHKRFMFNGNLYSAGGNVSTAGYLTRLYKWNGSAWETLMTSSSNDVAGGGMDSVNWTCAEYNGKLHMVNGKVHHVFNGTTLVKSTNCMGVASSVCVWQGNLYLVDDSSSTTRGLYEWDDTSSTWNLITSFSFYPGGCFVYGENLYCISDTSVYKYVDGALTSWGTAPYSLNYVRVGDELYGHNRNSGSWYKVNLETMEYTEIGTIPLFDNIYPTLNADELSFTACTYTTNSRFPFFVATIVEATE